MNSVEQRLQRAAEETRQVARTRRPQRLEARAGQQRRGLLAFAAAFALVVVTFGLVPWLAGIGDTPPVADTPPPVEPAVTSTTWPPTTLDMAPDNACPDVPLPGPIEGLPTAVTETRDAIIAAAASCDFETLESLAGEPFTTSFGGGGAENLAIWNDRGLEPTATLLNLLDMRHTTLTGEDGPDIYVWPAAYAYQSWDQITEEDLDELARIHSEGEFDLFAQSGSYMGWRTGIDENGNWLFFVAGD